MHEHSLMDNLLAAIATVAQRQRAKRVLGVTVRLGAWSHLSADHLRAHFEAAASGTIADGARLDVTRAEHAGDTGAQDLRLESVELEY